jgi:phage/plasmid primase-like uncharacterized protein
MDLQAIAQKLQLAGFNIEPHQIKESGKWENSRVFNNRHKSGRYIIGSNLCSYINNLTGESGSFVLDKAKVISSFEINKKRWEFEKAERNKYFLNALQAKKKFDAIINSNNLTSPYLDRKQVKNFGCRIDENGNLVIPFRSLTVRPDGTCVSYIKTLQTIRPDGTKLLETGCEKKGSMHFIGFNKIYMEPGSYSGNIFVAEGYATAASIHMAIGKPVVVAIDAGNLDPVMSMLIRAYPKAALVICADNDIKTELKIGKNVGIEAAKVCQEKYGCKVVTPNFLNIENAQDLSDFNDLYVAKGLEYIKQKISADLNFQAEKYINCINTTCNQQTTQSTSLNTDISTNQDMVSFGL